MLDDMFTTYRSLNPTHNLNQSLYARLDWLEHE